MAQRFDFGFIQPDGGGGRDNSSAWRSVADAPRLTGVEFDIRLNQEYQQPKSDFERFMSGEWVNMVSSNVAAAAYIPEQLELNVQYHDGSVYAYYNIGREDAQGMFMASSKGGWVWDNLRIRRTKLGYRKEYSWLSGISARERVYEQEGRTALHGMEATRQTIEALREEQLTKLFGAFNKTA